MKLGNVKYDKSNLNSEFFGMVFEVPIRRERREREEGKEERERERKKKAS